MVSEVHGVDGVYSERRATITAVPNDAATVATYAASA